MVGQFESSSATISSTSHNFSVTPKKLDGTPLDDPNKGKNPAAVALGRLGGLKGGRARTANLTKRKLKAIGKKEGAKDKNVPSAKQGKFGIGSVWTWTALDADTKLRWQGQIQTDPYMKAPLPSSTLFLFRRPCLSMLRYTSSDLSGG